MSNRLESCPYEKIYDVQFRTLQWNLAELKERVQRLEAVLARGTLLLVANLGAVTLNLMQELLRG